MPQRRAAKKDLRQNKKKYQQNLQLKQKTKAAINKFKKSLENKDVSLSQQALKEVCRILDKASTKNILHKNKAARKKSRFSKLLKNTTSKSAK